MKKLFLNELPKKEGRGANKGKMVIDWNNCKGYIVICNYKNKEYELKILNYDVKSAKVTIEYNHKMYMISGFSLKEERIGRIVGEYTREFKVKIGEVFKDDKRDLRITDREYRVKDKLSRGNLCKLNEKWYKYTCNTCGWTEGWILECNLLKDIGCSCCARRTPVLGINTIWDTDKWMIPIVGEEIAKSHTTGNDIYVNVKCPNCGTLKKKKKKLSSIYQTKSMGCEVCGFGNSLSERIMMAVLKQLKVDFIKEYSPEWAKLKRYDFYIPSLNMVIEVHGIQHYEDIKRMKSRTLIEEQENDKLKKELALSNGIDKYIVIDCRKSNFYYIKNSIQNSQDFIEHFSIGLINWYNVEEGCMNNIIKEACYMKIRNPELSTTEIGDKLGVSSTTIGKYLKIGSKTMNDLNYNPIKERLKGSIKSGKLGCKSVLVYKDNKMLGKFNSITELSNKSEEYYNIKFTISGISQCCNGRLKQYKGYKFKYVINNCT